MTLVSEGGAYGGPLSVASGQAVELARRGHDVTLFAGWDGCGVVDAEGTALEVRLFRAKRVIPASGFSGLIAPGLTQALRAHQPFDIVHIHLARDLITLSAGLRVRRASIPYVVQTHGMVGPDGRLRARLADLLATRRVLGGATAVLALTELEQRGLGQLMGSDTTIAHINNGVASFAGDHNDLPSDPTPDVLFCARLHPRKRVLVFADMAAVLLRRGVKARFSVVGPDEGQLAPLLARIGMSPIEGAVRYEGALAPHAVSPRLRIASVYVLPSVDETFPVTVLEAMAQGTPVVLTETCGIAADLESRGAALVTDGSPGQLADAVARVLAEPGLGESLALRGLEAVRTTYGISAVVDSLESTYAEAVKPCAN